MIIKLVPISERLPTTAHFKHRLDKILFYDNNRVKFLLGKHVVLGETKEGFLASGFTHWVEEK